MDISGPLLNLQFQSSIPVRTHFSLHRLLAELPVGFLSVDELARARAAGLFEPLCPIDKIVENADLATKILRGLFPEVLADQIPAALMVPFQIAQPLWTSPPLATAFQREALATDGSLGLIELRKALTQTAYVQILTQHYKLKLPAIALKTLLVTKDAEGFPIYWNYNFMGRYCEVIAKNAPVMTPSLAAEILNHLHDSEKLQQLLPPENFTFAGFHWIFATLANAEEISSQIQSVLVRPGNIIQIERLTELQARFRELFKSRNLELSLTFVVGQELMTIAGCEGAEKNCVVRDSVHHSIRAVREGELAHLFSDAKIKIVRSLQKSQTLHPLLLSLKDAGHDVAAVLPVLDEGVEVGFVTLASPTVNELNYRNTPLFQEMAPWFAGAMKNSLASREQEIEAAIKANFTSVHPSLEWRFVEAAKNLLAKEEQGFAEIEPIEFPAVYPLFGSSDIRSSSRLRAEAIRRDLRTQIEAALMVMNIDSSARRLPVVELLRHKLADFRQQIEMTISAGDEIEIANYFAEHVHPALRSLETLMPELKNPIATYWAGLDPVVHSHFAERRKFETSVAQINRLMSRFVDRMQANAQEIYPHFFEKLITDGLDHDIYLGESLTPAGHRKFDPFFLKNIRLWQLKMMCGLAVLSHEAKPHLPIALETAHLVVVQHNPITVFFDYDEKRLAVQGAYNIRYEIIKKRIDKVHLLGSDERLTQPGKLAIVYSHDGERAEYLEYLDYLHKQGLILANPEELALEDLQDVEGLRAIRASVNLAAVFDERGLIDQLLTEPTLKRAA